MEFIIPEAMKLEHEELHHELVRAIELGGRTGTAAQAVADVLHPHFVKEEQFALPPLGLLPLLGQGTVEPEMSEALKLTETLRAELPQMLEEHKLIVASLDMLAAVAETEGKAEVAEFAHKLKLHAQSEEQVAYPTTLLIGEFLKLKLPVPA